MRPRDEESREVEEIREDFVFVGGGLEVVVTRRASGADLPSEHPVGHERMTVTPLGHVLVQVHERADQAEGHLHDRLLAVELDQKGRVQGLG